MLKRAEQLGYGKDKDSYEDKYGEDMNNEIKGYAEYIEKEFGDLTKEEKEKLVDGQEKKIRTYYENKMADSEPQTPIEDAMQKMGDVLRRVMSELLNEQEKGTITESLQKEIKSLIDSDYHEYMIDKGDAPATNQRKVSWQKVLPKSHERQRYIEHRKAMRGVIGKLKRKIQLYGNPNKLTITNQKRGKLNKRMLHRIPSGRDDLFKVEVRKEDNPLDVCLLVDESGSMRYATMDKAREACIAVKESLQDNEKLNLWVFGHSGDEKERYATEMYEYASPTMRDRQMACGAMTARYENRDGTAILASAEKVRNESINPTTKKLMIIFSDGSPSAAGYRGQRAMEHVRKSVKKAESMGFSVIQVGFAGAYGRYQEQMFDNHLYVDDMQKLPLKISKILQKVMKL